MIRMKELNNDFSKIKELLDESGFLDGETVTYVAGDTPIIYTSGTVNSLTITDQSENMLFRLEQVSTNTAYNQFAAYASSSLSKTNGDGNSRSFQDGISCSNGVILRMYVSPLFPEIVITRANNGKMVFIYDSAGRTRVNDIACIAWGDVSPLRTINLKTHVRPQTLVAPLVTNSSFDEIVYTPKAGWMPYNSDYTSNLRAILINGRRFITDGTYAIEDE